VLVTVDEEIGGGSVDQLEAALRGRFPMVGGNALADDASRHRDELVIDVADAKLVDLGADFLHQLLAAGLVCISFPVGHRGPLSVFSIRIRRGISVAARSL